ncbi:MAG: DUF885 domain-containing protein [Anaerorhabdus sp.]|uniref:DUF885 domain-containing protein n=1 Tax=Anaerorhabdus sp. TaxID=1872524 RepID=UPI002FC612E0
MLFKKIFKVILSTILMIGLAGCQTNSVTPTINNEEEQARFDAFTNNEIKNYLEDNYLTIHRTVSKPEVFGVDMNNVVVQMFAPWSEDQFNTTLEEFESSKKEFESFDRDTLTEKQQNTYDIIQDQIELNLITTSTDFEYVGNVFGLFSGIQIAIPQVLTDFVFYDEKDVQDFIILMNSINPMFESYIEYAKKQKDAGYFMADYNVDEIVKYVDNLVNQGYGDEMMTVIEENINAFDGIDDDAKANYIEQAKTSYTESIVPAYMKLAEELTALKDPNNNQFGLAHYENGKEIYELYYRMYTGSNLTIEEAEKMLQEKMTASLQEMQIALMKDPEALELIQNNDLKAGYDSYADMIENLITWSKDHYTEIKIPEYEAVPASKLVSDGVGAYYITPFIDKEGKNFIRVNTNNAELVDNLQTYYYIAHEGVPGHMYYYNYVVQNDIDPYNLLLATYLGFSEGFANYGASYALESANTNETLKEVMRANFDFSWALSAMIDIGIHYRGWTMDEFNSFLESYGYGGIDMTSSYYMTQSNPGVNLSYGVGYFQILDLRTKAETELGDKFDEKAFNDTLLKSGNAPFDIVNKNVEDYIANNK